jgi:lipopolysaccharide/colanic/teichoic acid biosynthesis glycosyltransferase
LIAVTRVQGETEYVALDEFRLNREHYRPYKRAMDVTFCLLALPLLLPLMGIIALLIVLDSPGSPLFLQERIGKDGCRFRLYKFRTLRADYDDAQDRVGMQSFVSGQAIRRADGQDAINKPIRTRDITRVGRLLRKSSLDELPQIINVLRGEMSLIGPRPNVPWEVECYKDWHLERLEVLPGISGLAQVQGRSTLTFDEIATYDIKYVRTMSLNVDMTILVDTIRSVFSGKGAL